MAAEPTVELDTRQPSVLVLDAPDDMFESDLATLLAGDVSLEFAQYDDLCFLIDQGTVQVFHIPLGRELVSFDAVYFSRMGGNVGIAAALAEYLARNGVPFFDRAIMTILPPTKLTQYVRLAQNGLPIPTSIFLANTHLTRSYEFLVERLGLPFILKGWTSRRGLDNHLISRRSELESLFTDRSEGDRRLRFIAQTYVPNSGDLRMLVMSNTVDVVIHRTAQGPTHLNNTSQGSRATLVNREWVDRKLTELAVRAAQIMDRQIAGVDIVRDRVSGAWHILEVNAGPQISSGTFVATKVSALADYVRRQFGERSSPVRRTVASLPAGLAALRLSS